MASISAAVLEDGRVKPPRGICVNADPVGWILGAADDDVVPKPEPVSVPDAGFREGGWS